MEKFKKILKLILIILLVIAMVIPVGRRIYDNIHVKFSDDNMGEVICGSMRGGEVTPENVTRKDLKELKRLEIGFVGYYETLKDIRYCTEIEDLAVNWGVGDYDPAFAINHGKANRKLTKDEVNEVQEELGKILPRLSDLKILWISDFGGVEWTSLEFLENCNQIEELQISRCKVKDYSVLQTCTALTHLSIDNSKISKAEDIIGIERLEFITLFDTPLAKNSEEIKKLQKAYPDAEIRWEREE